MNSLEIVETKLNIENFIEKKIDEGLPLEVVRMMLNEMLGKYTQRVNVEVNNLIAERAKKSEVAE